MANETEQKVVLPSSNIVWNNLTEAAKGYALLLEQVTLISKELDKAKAELEALKKSKK